MTPEDTQSTRCPECGAEVREGAKFCTACAAPIAQSEDKKAQKKAMKAFKKRTRGEPHGVDPWAVKAGDAIGRVPRWVKMWVPLTILIIIAIIIALSVVAGGHTPQAAVERYLGNLRDGKYKTAYDMIERQGGKFGTFDYFSQWQLLQTDKLGQLRSFSVRKKDVSNRLFGKLVQPEPSSGTDFVATLNYKEKTYDVDIFAVDNGGGWPARSFKIKLSDGATRSIVAPFDAEIAVDGMEVGRAVENQDLKDALALGHFPKSLNDAVDYVKTLLQTFQNSVIDIKALLNDLDAVTGNVQNTLERLSTSGISWQQVVDAWDQVASQSKSFAGDVGRSALHLYWIFGGGDDGTVRARYTRVETGLDLSNLPGGWHQIRVTLPGMEPQQKVFYAPETVSVSLDPTRGTEDEFEGVVQNYFSVRSSAFFTLNPVALPSVAGGTVLQDDLAHVADLGTRGLHQASDLLSLKYDKFKVLTPDVATVDTEENWNFTIYQATTPVSTVSNQKNKVTYTLQRESGTWKVTEARVK